MRSRLSPSRNTVASPSGSARYDALGYVCRSAAGSSALPLVQPQSSTSCRTVFFIDARSGRLGLFYTTQARDVGRHGVHVGMAQRTAERLLHRRVTSGCISSLELTSPGVAPVVRFLFDGGTIMPRGADRIRSNAEATADLGLLYARDLDSAD